jgi:hypothetical protein
MIKIDFEFETEYGVFRDALHLLDDNTFTEAEIQAMKNERVDNWINVITTPNTEPETNTEPEVPTVVEVPSQELPDIIEVNGVKYTRVV